MHRIFGSLVVRLGLVFLLGLILLQGVIATAMLLPDGRPTIFRLVSPHEAVAIAKALEASSESQRQLILAAFNAGQLTVHIAPDFPADVARNDGRDAPYLKRLYGGYAYELEGRAFRVQAKADAALTTRQGSLGEPWAVRLLVRLKTGDIVVIERSPVLIQRLFERFAVIGGAAAVILILVMLICIYQMARPAKRLAQASRDLATNINMPDLPIRGPTEIRTLSRAFNDMKHTIRALMDERTRTLAAIAHDLRTYLTRLRLRSEFIADADQRRRAIDDLDEMGLLLDDTLMFAREATTTSQKPAAIDVEKEISDFVALRHEIGDPVAYANPVENPISACCAPLAFRRMLANLTDNAIRYGKNARLNVRQEAGVVEISVEDEGPGVPFETMSRLMQPFERLEPSRGRRTGGAGLGLAIVKALAKSQGGDLTIENVNGGGLRATIILTTS
jgi:two-component system osmolarity sensor histidine kinase EnvZ